MRIITDEIKRCCSYQGINSLTLTQWTSDIRGTNTSEVVISINTGGSFCTGATETIVNIRDLPVCHIQGKRIRSFGPDLKCGLQSERGICPEGK